MERKQAKEMENGKKRKRWFENVKWNGKMQSEWEEDGQRAKRLQRQMLNFFSLFSALSMCVWPFSSHRFVCVCGIFVLLHFNVLHVDFSFFLLTKLLQYFFHSSINYCNRNKRIFELSHTHNFAYTRTHAAVAAATTAVHYIHSIENGKKKANNGKIANTCATGQWMMRSYVTFIKCNRFFLHIGIRMPCVIWMAKIHRESSYPKW